MELQLLVTARRVPILSFCFMDPDIVEVGISKNYQRVSALYLQDLLGITGDLESMAHAPEIRAEVFLHLQSDSLLQGIPLFSPLPYLHILGDCPNTLLCVGAPGGTAQIDFGIDHFMPAPASTPDFILEKFDLSFTFRALDLKDIFGPPESHILSWASHLALLPEIA